MKTCTSKAIAIRIAAICAVVVLSSAFDWKPKPTPQLKADLVEYARKVGETKFADRIEKTTSTAEWMRAAIKRGSELLKESEGADFNDKRREHGLRIIDYPLHVNNSFDKKATEEDKAAFKEVIGEYCRAARDRVFKEVAAAKVPNGSLRLWRIYNMGFIIKGPKHTIAIDITNRPLFYGMPGKPYMADTEHVVWNKEDCKRLAGLADMIFVTHPHGDHYFRDCIEAFIAAGKPVVLPCDLVEYVSVPPKEKKGRWSMATNSFTTASCCVKLTKDNAEPVDVKGVKVRNFHGDQGKDIPCNVYLIEIDGMRVAHNGDNYDRSKEAKLAKCPPADVIIASTWNNIQSMVRNCSAAPGFDGKKAVLIPAHENELNHRVQQRESYWEMYTRKDRLGDRKFPWPRVLPMGYGENITVTPPHRR